jgi:hypothetical protein
MTRDARPWTHAALLGALWGCLELSLGTVLHLGGVPMKGLVMGSFGIICLVCLRRLQPRPGVCLIAGAVAVFLKVFTLGGLYPGPVIGIAGEAVLVELAFLLARESAAGAVIGGALALAINPVQMTLMTLVVAGPEALKAAVELARGLGERAGFSGLSGAAILLTLVLLNGLAGACVGAVSWRLAGRVVRRLGHDT